MYVDGKNANGSVAESSQLAVYSSSPEKQVRDGVRGDGTEVIKTYKRRKCLKPLVKEILNVPYSNGQEAGIHGSLRKNLHLCRNDLHLSNWLFVLEHILQSLQHSKGGIQSCIQDLVAHIRGHDYDDNKPPWKSPEELKRLVSSRSSAAGHVRVTVDESHKLPNSQRCVPSCMDKYWNVFVDIIASEKFISLCSLLSENFKGIKTEKLLNFSLIDSRMKTGEYELSSGLFGSDIQQMWDRLKEIGDEIVHLADSLSEISQMSYQKQEAEKIGCTMVVLSEESEQPTKLEQNEACGLKKISACGHCGTRATALHSLICDGCEATYHISCIKPVIAEIPTSWYCRVCSASGRDSPASDWTQNLSTDPHQNCVVCERAKASRLQTNGSESNVKIMITSISSSFEESLDNIEEVDRYKKSTKKGKQRLCKRCKTGESEGKQFLVCQHTYCPYKYYHKSCLRDSEIPVCGRVWYCPSCLCRGCLTDRDDNKIILCNGCDEAYHIYCTVPPRTSIPKEDWYCMFCNIEIRIRQKRLRRNVLKGMPAGSMDVLLSAAEKLHSEERSNNR